MDKRNNTLYISAKPQMPTQDGVFEQIFFVPIEFEVTKWEPVITQPLDPLIWNASGADYAGVNIGEIHFLNRTTPGDTFELDVEVKMKPLQIPESLANEIVSQWEGKILQNIVQQPTPVTRNYTKGTQSLNLAPLPCADPPQDGFDHKPFVDASEAVALKHGDTPGDGPPIYINSNEPFVNQQVRNDHLLSARAETVFVTWVYVENNNHGDRQFLKWIKWRVRWNVSVNHNNAQPGINSLIAPFAEIIDAGDGQGPNQPSFQPRTRLWNYQPTAE